MPADELWNESDEEDDGLELRKFFVLSRLP